MSKEKGSMEIIELLEQLAAYKRFILAEEYAKKFFDPDKTYEKYIEHCDEELHKKMELVNCVVDSFFPSDIATLVHLHYINNMSVEQCAECMYLSRATAFRLLTKAHDAIGARYQLIKEETKA